MTFTEPMLAASLLPPDVECNDDTVMAAMRQLRYPVMATLKKDGVRALRLNGTLLSRRLKRIPNKELCAGSVVMPGGFDVELWNRHIPYNDIQSIVMSRVHKNTEDIEFHVIDWFYPNISYAERMVAVTNIMPDLPKNVKFSPPVWCENADQLFMFEQLCIEEAGEGICFRWPKSYYKCGRSTLVEQGLVKLARVHYDEAEIIGFEEQMENGNTDAGGVAGRISRGHSMAELRGKGTLGAFFVRNTAGQQFYVGTGVGLTSKYRQEIWDNQDKYLGRTIRYKTKQHGTKILPRSPVMCGFRDKKKD